MSNENANTENKVTPKKLLVGIVTKFAEANVDLAALLGTELAEKVANFYDSIKSTAVRGLPATERLAMVEGLINAHYDSMPDRGSEEFANWSYESMKLLQRQERIKREIAEGGAHPEPKKKSAKK